MPPKPKKAAAQLYSIAESQQGYFTAAQGIEAGFADYLHPYHVRTGEWERVYRGIYRLSKYPCSMDSHYVVWSLWSRNREGVPQGVYSHETALSMFDLSDANPAKIHLTVPPEFRRHSGIPKILVLHKAVLTRNETAERDGYRVTRPFRTIRDLLHNGTVALDLIHQALREALSRGLMVCDQIDTLSKEFPDEKHLFRDLFTKAIK